MILVFFQRLCQAGKAKEPTLTVYMRKPLTILNAMLKSSAPWLRGQSAYLRSCLLLAKSPRYLIAIRDTNSAINPLPAVPFFWFKVLSQATTP